MDNYKYLIIGQGIAGTLVAMECLQRGISFVVIDKATRSRASKVAAGIINPITGRKFVKTWMYEELEQVFLPCYKGFEELLGDSYLKERSIIRAIPTVVDQNNWDARAMSADAGPYMNSDVILDEYEGSVKVKYGYGEVAGYQLRISKLLEDFRSYLKENDLLLDDKFEFSHLKITPDKIEYKNEIAEHAIFCEGHLVSENPYFSYLPFSPGKGELLLVRIPDLNTERLLKDQIFIVPFEEDLYWVGATYAWENLNDSPTEEKNAWLTAALEKVLNTPYEIVNHLAGVRPATKFRRPLMGTHEAHDNLHLFNGLGTKGSSLGPYWAKKLMDFLENGEQLDEQVNLSRGA